MHHIPPCYVYNVQLFQPHGGFQNNWIEKKRKKKEAGRFYYHELAKNNNELLKTVT